MLITAIITVIIVVAAVELCVVAIKLGLWKEEKKDGDK